MTPDMAAKITGSQRSIATLLVEMADLLARLAGEVERLAEVIDTHSADLGSDRYEVGRTAALAELSTRLREKSPEIAAALIEDLSKEETR